MAAKLVELNEAATKLGVTPEQLMEMRQKGEVFGIRDGGSWKFKEEEIARVLAERAGGSGLSLGDDLDELIEPMVLDDDDDDLGSILISEQELGESAESASSTIIGKNQSKPTAAKDDSDILLASDSGKAGASDLNLVGPGSDLGLAGASDVHASGASDLKLGSSDVELAGMSDLQLAGDGGTGKQGSDVLGAGSSAKLDFTTDSALDLGDDELVLGGSGIGSDVTLGGGDSGINLASPADSGLSLEDEPLELMGGSNVDTAFELPEDDDVISLESEVADPDEATQLKADVDFLLSPAGDFGGDESDSGSQVIALEDSEAFDENADTMLRPGQPGLLVEDSGVGFEPIGGATATATAAAPMYVSPSAPEAPYSIWNILGLLACVLLLAVSGMLMTDVMLNMWAFDDSRTISTGLMDALVSALPKGN